MTNYNSIINQLPGLKSGEFKFVKNSDYKKGNCIALSLNLPSPWIWPDAKGYVRSNGIMYAEFWPRTLNNDYTLENFLRMYSLFGFEQTNENYYENGIWKNVLYGHDENNITHAAHILKDGSCVSKLGKGPLLIHKPKAIEGVVYGHIITYVKRPLPLNKEEFLATIVNNA